MNAKWFHQETAQQTIIKENILLIKFYNNQYFSKLLFMLGIEITQ